MDIAFFHVHGARIMAFRHRFPLLLKFHGVQRGVNIPRRNTKHYTDYLGVSDFATGYTTFLPRYTVCLRYCHDINVSKLNLLKGNQFSLREFINISINYYKYLLRL